MTTLEYSIIISHINWLSCIYWKYFIHHTLLRWQPSFFILAIINKSKILKFIHVLGRTSVLDIRPKCHPLYWTFILYGNTLLFIAIYFIPIIVNIKKQCPSTQYAWHMKYFHMRCDNQIICNRIKNIQRVSTMLNAAIE